MHVGVYFYNAYNCWIKNVRVAHSNRNHIWFYQSAHSTARDSYFYGPPPRLHKLRRRTIHGRGQSGLKQHLQHITAP